MKKTRSDVRLYRRAVAIEYMQSGQTREQIALKYGLPNVQTVSNWVNCYLNPLEIQNKCVNLHPEELLASIPMTVQNEPNKVSESDAMLTEKVSELEKQVEKLEKRLQKSQDKILALNTLIDIAEEQGMRIRKKSGVKQ